LAERAAEFGIWEVQVPNGLVTVSKGFTTLIGLPGTSRQFPLGELEQMLHPDDRTAIRAAAARALETGTFEAEFRIVLPDGTIRWQRSQGRVELTDGAARRATGALIDITDEKALLIRLEEARTAAEALARAAQGAEHLELDRKNVLELVALDRPLDKIALTIARAVSRHPALASCSLQIQLPGAARISVSTHIAQPFARALAQIPIDGIRETLSATPIAALSDDPEWQRCAGAPIAISQERYLAAPIRQNKLVAGTIVVVLPAGQHVSVADGELLESWARFASLAIERRGLYEQLSFRAQYDDLTTLLNRASLYACLEAQIAAATQSGGAMAVMYFDLDSFKQINDRYGHAAGDAVLRTASQRMLHNIRCTDVAARVGGDEFVILLPGVSDRGDAVRSAELIGQAISEPMEIAGIDVRVGSSAGIAMYPADGRHADALLKAADAEMYRIKRSHRSESLR
jgi:diguanylate cyclase (GGDEF)-like protein